MSMNRMPPPPAPGSMVPMQPPRLPTAPVARAPAVAKVSGGLPPGAPALAANPPVVRGRAGVALAGYNPLFAL